MNTSWYVLVGLVGSFQLIVRCWKLEQSENVLGFFCCLSQVTTNPRRHESNKVLISIVTCDHVVHRAREEIKQRLPFSFGSFVNYNVLFFGIIIIIIIIYISLCIDCLIIVAEVCMWVSELDRYAGIKSLVVVVVLENGGWFWHTTIAYVIVVVQRQSLSIITNYQYHDHFIFTTTIVRMKMDQSQWWGNRDVAIFGKWSDVWWDPIANIW